jgi:MFS family permease
MKYNNETTMDSNRGAVGSPYAWLVWLLSALFVLFQFFLQLTSGVIVAGLMKSFSLSALGGGVLASSYYYIYVLLQAPGGFFVDAYGARKILSAGAVVCALGCVVFATASHLGMAIIGRLTMGIGASIAFVGSMNLVTRWFPMERFGLMVALAEVSGMAGGLLGGVYLSHLVQEQGWRVAMEGSAVVSLVLAILLCVIIRDAPDKKAISSTKQSIGSLWDDLQQLIKQPIVWLNGAYSGAVFGVITIFVALWGIPFFQKLHHLSLSQATLVCDIVFIGVSVGAPLIGWLDARLNSRKALLSVCAFLAAGLLSITIMDASLSIVHVAILMFFLGVVSSAYVLNFVIASEIASYRMQSTSVGITNMISVGAAPIVQPLIGLVLYLLSDHIAQTGFESYTVAHFQLALSMVPILLVVAGVVALWLPNRSN